MSEKKNLYKRKPYLKDDRFLHELGQRIKEVRLEKGFTQEALANAINVDISQISRLERGILNASVSMIKEVAVALNIDMAELFSFEYTRKLVDQIE